MCGIFCSVVNNQNDFLNELAHGESLRLCNNENFSRRGPDALRELQCDVSSQRCLQFACSVLWTQGAQLTEQPIQDSKGNVLLWNGDIFSGPLASDESDTKQLSLTLDSLSDSSSTEKILNTFGSIKGPYSFIYFSRCENKLFFGRDVLGRHSLVIHFTPRNKMISSVSCKCSENQVLEVPAAGIFFLDLSKEDEIPMFLHPWSHIPKELLELKLKDFKNFDNHILEPIPSSLITPERTKKEPSEVDLQIWFHCSSDRSLSELMDKLGAGDLKNRNMKIMSTLSEKKDLQILINDFKSLLEMSVKIRVQKQPKICQNCLKNKEITCGHSKVSILFSGGLDSAVLSVLAHQFVPEEEPIDLLNVAFEKLNFSVESGRGKKFENLPKFKVPDRETGLKTLQELQQLCPSRKWNFIEINVTQSELQQRRKDVISSLIHPLNTVLDDSLGCALWFASRGEGILNNVSYTSPARIILSGIGADEQLGGYMRHRTVLKHRGGWAALDKTLSFELGRISERNLGRDDRVVSHHGRQLRMPYLDEDVVNFLTFLPPWQRCNPIDAMPTGIGDKLLLRLVAWKLGLQRAATFPKRAMQFGSRIANSRENGVAISDRL